MTNPDLMDTNDYTGVPKSPMVAAAEDAARLAKLEEENDRLRSEAGYHGAQDVIAQVAAERDALLARLARLESALLKYGQHSPRCPVWATMTRGTCTCGLDAALEGRNDERAMWIEREEKR